MEAHETGPDETVDVEIRTLSVFARVGITEAEREVGQRLEFDISFEVPDCDAVLTDRIEDTISYHEVAQMVAEVANEREYKTLERLGHVVAERVRDDFGGAAATVRVAKPEPPVELPLGEVAVEISIAPEEEEPPDELGEETA
ncbi:MAG: dihydroneopterin aldolase [Solirubrobacterales bacterium]